MDDARTHFGNRAHIADALPRNRRLAQLHGTRANQRPPAGAGTKFCQGHAYRHYRLHLNLVGVMRALLTLHAPLAFPIAVQRSFGAFYYMDAMALTMDDLPIHPLLTHLGRIRDKLFQNRTGGAPFPMGAHVTICPLRHPLALPIAAPVARRERRQRPIRCSDKACTTFWKRACNVGSIKAHVLLPNGCHSPKRRPCKW